MAGLLAIFCITAPYAGLPLQRIPAFIAVHGTAVLAVDTITAAVIFAQFWVVRWTWLLVLASGFFFTALITVAFTLTFPETFTPSGLLGAGAQTSAWLALCWLLASPLFLITAILAQRVRAKQADYMATLTGPGHRFQRCSGDCTRVQPDLGLCCRE